MPQYEILRSGVEDQRHAYFIIHSQIMFQGVRNILTHQEMWDGTDFSYTLTSPQDSDIFRYLFIFHCGR